MSDRCHCCRSILSGSSACPVCGYDQKAMLATYERVPLSAKVAKLFHRPIAPSYRAGIPWKRPLVAAVLAGVFIGSGHLYVGRYLEGALLLAVAFALSWAVIGVSLWALFFLAVIWQWQIFSAHDHAVDYNWASIYQCEGRGR